MIYTVEPLQKHHDRASFDCGEDSLNLFIKQFARQNSEKGLGRTFVAVLPDDAKIYGYYTIASGAVRFDSLPEKLPRYPIPVILLGRLAVDNSAKGQKLGEGLLFDALKRVVSVAAELGVYAVEVYALNESARAFYLKYGFVEMLDERLHLHLPLKTLKDLGI